MPRGVPGSMHGKDIQRKPETWNCRLGCGWSVGPTCGGCGRPRDEVQV